MGDPHLEKLSAKDISLVANSGSAHSECYVRVFVKHHKMSQAVADAFHDFFKENFSKPPVVRTKRKSLPRKISPTHNQTDLNISREEEEFSDLNLSRESTDQRTRITISPP